MGDLLEVRVRVVVARPEALEVEDADAAELADLDGRGGADDAVHGCPHQRELEAEGVDLPRDIHVLGVPCPPARDDRNVVEAVSLPPCFALTYLDFHSACLSYASRCCQHASLLGSGLPPRHDRPGLSRIRLGSRAALSASGSGARQADSDAGGTVSAGRLPLPVRRRRGRRLSGRAVHPHQVNLGDGQFAAVSSAAPNVGLGREVASAAAPAASPDLARPIASSARLVTGST